MDGKNESGPEEADKEGRKDTERREKERNLLFVVDAVTDTGCEGDIMC